MRASPAVLTDVLPTANCADLTSFDAVEGVRPVDPIQASSNVPQDHFIISSRLRYWLHLTQAPS
jgi:hypothetical protein